MTKEQEDALLDDPKPAQGYPERIATLQMERYSIAEQCAKLQIRVGELEAALEAAQKERGKSQVPFPWRGTVEAKERAEKRNQDLHTLLRELCEKMEAGISGAEETKRARAMLCEPMELPVIGQDEG